MMVHPFIVRRRKHGSKAATLAGAVGNTEHLDEDMHQDPVST